MPLESSESARADLKCLLELCLQRLEAVLKNDALEVRELLAVGKEARALREILDDLYPAPDLPPQEFHLRLTVEDS